VDIVEEEMLTIYRLLSVRSKTWQALEAFFKISYFSVYIQWSRKIPGCALGWIIRSWNYRN